MIYDCLENLYKYRGITPNLDTVIDFITQHAPQELPMGRTDIDGERAWLTKHENPMRSEEAALWERHQLYIDLQIGLKDGELVDYLPVDCLSDWQDWQGDLQLSHDRSKGITLPLNAGTFMIFFGM